MKRFVFYLSINIFTAAGVPAQFSQEARDSINRESNLDHQMMMKELGITHLRPGPSGDPKAPDAANTDESKVPPYPEMPDPLVFKDGFKVDSPDKWEKRRKEIMEDFDREIYGRVPANTPAVDWEILSQKDTINGTYPVRIKNLAGHADNSGYPAVNVNIEMTLVTPLNISAPVPVIIELSWIPPANWKIPQPEGPTWQQLLLDKGWGYALLIPTSFQADNGAGLKQGIIGLMNKGQPRKPDDWGTLRAWAWGVSRALDYFKTDRDVDPKRVGVEGLSRYGKAAVVAMAYESRLAIGFIGSSGAGGTKIFRRIFGEQVENLASSYEYHWFAPNFIKYAGPLTQNDLPVDAHELIALCAPRPVFISAGSSTVEGGWVDAKGMFLSGVLAGPVYELLGKKGLGAEEFPPQETSLTEGDIAFRQHSGGHTVVPNWPYFIKFAEKYFPK